MNIATGHRPTTTLPSLPPGKLVRVGDHAKTCMQRKDVARALNAQSSHALLALLLALLALFNPSPHNLP